MPHLSRNSSVRTSLAAGPTVLAAAIAPPAFAGDPASPPATKDYAARGVIVGHFDTLVPTLAPSAQANELLRGIVAAHESGCGTLRPWRVARLESAIRSIVLKNSSL
jgi:hypothetical protein